MAPKSFSEAERAAIDQRLRAVAADCLNRYGVRKTTVDELVRLANIPKGTFYLFYPSKEELFFSLFIEMHDKLRQDFFMRLTKAGPSIGWRDLADALLTMCRETGDIFLVSLMADGELELILRKLPPELVAQHQNDDDGNMEQMFTMLPQLAGKNPEVYSAAMRGVFLLLINKREIGEAVFDDVLKVTIYGLCRQLFAEDTL